MRSSKYMLGSVLLFCLAFGLFSGELDEDLLPAPGACSSNEYSLLLMPGLKYMFGMTCECLFMAGEASKFDPLSRYTDCDLLLPWVMISLVGEMNMLVRSWWEVA